MCDYGPISTCLKEKQSVQTHVKLLQISLLGKNMFSFIVEISVIFQG